jgi:hypothetical protein
MAKEKNQSIFDSVLEAKQRNTELDGDGMDFDRLNRELPRDFTDYLT